MPWSSWFLKCVGARQQGHCLHAFDYLSGDGSFVVATPTSLRSTLGTVLGLARIPSRGVDRQVLFCLVVSLWLSLVTWCTLLWLLYWARRQTWLGCVRFAPARARSTCLCADAHDAAAGVASALALERCGAQAECKQTDRQSVADLAQGWVASAAWP